MKSKLFKKKINNLYSKIREKNARELERRRDEISKNLPKYDELMELSKNHAIKIARAAIRNPEGNKEEIERLKNELNEIREERLKLLKKHAYGEDYLEEIYTCPECCDTGYINAKECPSCYKKMVAIAVMEDSEFKDLLKKNNFENFDINLFSDEKIENYRISPRKNIEINKKVAMHFIKEFENENLNSLLLLGKSGTGKTYLATSIANELIKKGMVVIYRTASNLINEIRDMDMENDRSSRDLLLEADLLIIDDLGTENTTDYSKMQIFNIINGRLLKNKKMIISTNLSLSEIGEYYSERVQSRLAGDFLALNFFGYDLRLINRNEYFNKIKKIIEDMDNSF